MDESPNLNLPYIMASQAQKHVTHNEAIRDLDALVQLSVLDRDLTTPPTSPVDGDRYLVATGSTGAWLGRDGNIAAYQDNAWVFHAQKHGWVCWVVDELKLLVWDGLIWIDTSVGGGSNVNPAPLIGVNTTADVLNRLSVSSANTLFSHEGSDHRAKINKADVADTASFLFQNNFSGRAEVGLTGDDDFHFKVSPDGSTFYEGIVIDKDTGEVDFPNGTTLSTGGGSGGSNFNWVINGDFTVNQRSGTTTPGIGVYGYDRWKGHADGLEQIVEALEAGEYTLTWTGGGTGTFGGTSAASPVKATVGSGNTSVVVPSNATRVSLILGDQTSADPFLPRHMSAEFSMCQRYYEVGQYYTKNPEAHSSVNQTWYTSAYFQVQKRATPSITGTVNLGTFWVIATSQSRTVLGRTSAVSNNSLSGTFTASSEL